MNRVSVHLDPRTPLEKKKKAKGPQSPTWFVSQTSFLVLGESEVKQEMQGSEAPKLQHFAVRLLSCQELMAERLQSRSAVRNIPRG